MTLWDEIHQQPAVLARTLAENAAPVAAVATDPRVEACTHVVIAARGTSDNAARYAKYLWGARNGRMVGLAAPSLYGPYASPPRLDGALVVALSQSGASPDLVAVVEEAQRQGRPTVTITNTAGSPLADASDHVLLLHAGEERAVAATKTYTAQLAVVALLSAAWRDSDTSQLAQVPEVAAATLEQVVVAADDLGFLTDGGGLAVVGRGYHHATAFELALKVQELAQVLAHPYSAADFRHGPLALVEPGFPMVLVAAEGALADDMTDLHQRVTELGADVLVLSNGPALGLPGTRLDLRYPATVEWLSPIPAMVAGQILAHRLTEARGLDPDTPRTITKVTRTT